MRSSEAIELPEPSRVAEPERDFAGALHEVSNTLTVLLGWLDVAYAKLEPGAVREAIEVARTHAHLGYRVARRAIGAEVPAQEHLERSAASLARTAVLGVEPQAQRRGVRLRLDQLEHGEGVAVRDVTAVLQILTNLLLNAIAFSPKGSVVTLALSSDDSDVRFIVSDAGAGIDPTRARTLFSSPDSTRRGGAGLGLRHSCALAQSKGGDLRLTRHSPGAEFELRWPISLASSGQRRRSAPPEGIAGARILVIEDDPAVRSLIEFTLEARGASSLVVASGQELELVTSRRAVFDAALIDLSPLGDDIAGALSLLTRTNPGIQLIVISGAPTRLPDHVEAQLAAWVRKPFEMSEVVTVLASVLSRSKTQ